jgi:hypothetical protein
MGISAIISRGIRRIMRLLRSLAQAMTRYPKTDNSNEQKNNTKGTAQNGLARHGQRLLMAMASNKKNMPSSAMT